MAERVAISTRPCATASSRRRSERPRKIRWRCSSRRLGVDVIEAGFPSRLSREQGVSGSPPSRNPAWPPLARCRHKDSTRRGLEKTVSPTLHALRPPIHLDTSCADARPGARTGRQRRASGEASHRPGGILLEDATRFDLDYLVAIAKVAIEAGRRNQSPDTVGYTTGEMKMPLCHRRLQVPTACILEPQPQRPRPGRASPGAARPANQYRQRRLAGAGNTSSVVMTIRAPERHPFRPASSPRRLRTPAAVGNHGGCRAHNKPIVGRNAFAHRQASTSTASSPAASPTRS